MEKVFRFKFKVTNGNESEEQYDHIYAKNEQNARVEFSKLQDARLKHWRTDETCREFAELPNDWFEILAIDELDPATFTEGMEGAHLSTIPALRCLPRKQVIIKIADNPGCEWGWERKVWRDADGHDAGDKLEGIGCRGYMEEPPVGGPFYSVESVDGKLGVLLCQEHLAEFFPDTKYEIPNAAPVKKARGGKA